MDRLSPYVVPTTRRYWVVRAEAGRYYQHFINGSFIAINHLNALDININNTENYEPDFQLLKEQAKQQGRQKDLSPRQVISLCTQLKNFIFDMQPGDWVITVGPNQIRFGLITAPAYIENELHEHYTAFSDKVSRMDFRLRRPIEWGPIVSKDDIPYGLQSTLKANQTVFNADKHIEAIYHTLYPTFILDDSFHFSIKIRQEDDIKNQSMATLLSFMNEIEFISKNLDNHLTLDNYEDFLLYFKRERKLTITTKAQYHSPGDIWAKLNPKGIKSVGILVTCYSLLFGNSTLGVDGVMDLHTRQKLWDILIQRLEKTDIQEASQDLELQPPKYNTKKLESLDQQELIDT